MLHLWLFSQARGTPSAIARGTQAAALVCSGLLWFALVCSGLLWCAESVPLGEAEQKLSSAVNF